MRKAFVVALIVLAMMCASAGGEIVKQLPEDGAWPHASLVVHDNWRQIPAEARLVAQWQAEKPSDRLPLGTCTRHRILRIRRGLWILIGRSLYHARFSRSGTAGSPEQVSDGAQLVTFFGKRPWLTLPRNTPPSHRVQTAAAARPPSRFPCMTTKVLVMMRSHSDCPCHQSAITRLRFERGWYTPSPHHMFHRGKSHRTRGPAPPGTSIVHLDPECPILDEAATRVVAA